MHLCNLLPLAFVAAIGVGCSKTPEPASSATVWLDAARMQANDWIKTNQPWLSREGSRRHTQWLSGHYTQVSYTLVQRSHGLVEDNSCNQLPIRIQVFDDRVRAATYAATALPLCERGYPVNLNLYQFKLLTPTDMFDLIQDAATGDPVKTGNCLQVQFDESTGLPTELSKACTWIFDGGWSANITEISVH